MKLKELHQELSQFIEQGYGEWDVCAEVNIGDGYDCISLYDVEGSNPITKGTHIPFYGDVSRNIIKLILDW